VAGLHSVKHGRGEAVLQGIVVITHIYEHGGHKVRYREWWEGYACMVSLGELWDYWRLTHSTKTREKQYYRDV
jgi:hypothetical protein